MNKGKMVKNLMIYLVGFVLVLAIVASMMLLMRSFSNVVTVISVEQVAPGISCAKMVTNDGAAISCWKE